MGGLNNFLYNLGEVVFYHLIAKPQNSNTKSLQIRRANLVVLSL